MADKSSVVLGIPHPAVSTRDVCLYQPFRNALRMPNQVIGLQTLMWHFMRRQCQNGKISPVSNLIFCLYPLIFIFKITEFIFSLRTLALLWICTAPVRLNGRIL